MFVRCNFINLLIVHIKGVCNGFDIYILEKINVSDLEGLKLTSHIYVHISSLERSEFNLMAESRGS